MAWLLHGLRRLAATSPAWQRLARCGTILVAMAQVMSWFFHLDDSGVGVQCGHWLAIAGESME